MAGSVTCSSDPIDELTYTYGTDDIYRSISLGKTEFAFVSPFQTHPTWTLMNWSLHNHEPCLRPPHLDFALWLLT